MPMHMIDTINKIFRVQRQLLQSGGHEPSAEEIAEELNMSIQGCINIHNRFINKVKKEGNYV